VHCGSYFVALDLLAATDMVGVLTPALLRACMKTGQLVEIVLTDPLIPIQLGMYTRSGSPLTAPAKSAANMISTICKRIALTGELRSTAPLVVK
jgi:DNA-binding transcriptional LysR family regulator